MNNMIDTINKFFDELKNNNIDEINIIVHSVPDPDAVGSALGFGLIAKFFDIDSKIYYDGEISHPQNKTIVNILNIAMTKTNSEVEGVNVCVDCTPLNSCAKDALLVIDHHKSTYKAKYLINKPSYGACSTIVWELIKKLDIKDFSENIEVYTALLLGIRTDTNDLISENMSKNDFIAYQELLELADKEALQKVMNYPFPRYIYDKRLSLHKEGNYTENNGMFIGGIGFISASQKDVIAILAEEYARMESINTAVIFAIIDKKTLEISIRSSNISLDVNQMCKDLFGEYGGGTSYKGGAKIPLLFYTDIDEKNADSFWKTTCTHMFKKVLKESWIAKE